MVEAKSDRLKALYNMWLQEKERQFAELHDAAAARIAEKDEIDLTVDRLKMQLAEAKKDCGFWQDKYHESRKKKNKVHSHIGDLVREIDFLRS